jgi:hypothetical protein
MDPLVKDLINNIMSIKRNIAEIIRDRLYIKNFASRILEYLYELDDITDKITVEVLQVKYFYIFKRKLIYINA